MPIYASLPSPIGLGKVTSAIFNGLSFGAGQPIKIVEANGFDDLPTLRKGDIARSGDHGMFRGSDWLGERVVGFKLRIVGQANQAALDALIDSLRQATIVQTSQELPLIVNGNRLINCRPSRRFVPDPIDEWQSWTVAPEIEFTATDPRIYDSTLQQPNAGLATVSGGVTFPATFPLSFGAPASGGYIFVTNNGTFETRPVAVIQGPVTNPSIQNVTSGQTLAFSITLGNTDTLTVDFNARTVLLNGTGNRYNAITVGSSWFTLAPGNSTIRFLASTYSAGALLTLNYRSAWL